MKVKFLGGPLHDQERVFIRDCCTVAFDWFEPESTGASASPVVVRKGLYRGVAPTASGYVLFMFVGYSDQWSRA